jgi:hypothetical protein
MGKLQASIVFEVFLEDGSLDPFACRGVRSITAAAIVEAATFGSLALTASRLLASPHAPIQSSGFRDRFRVGSRNLWMYLNYRIICSS